MKYKEFEELTLQVGPVQTYGMLVKITSTRPSITNPTPASIVIFIVSIISDDVDNATDKNRAFAIYCVMIQKDKLSDFHFVSGEKKLRPALSNLNV